MATDASAADYHFNLAVSLKRHGENAEALAELAQCLRLHPNDTEAQSLEAQWKSTAQGAAVGAGTSAGGEPKADPLERIARNFDAQAFRQAAQMLDQVDATRLAALTPEKRAQMLSGRRKST